MANPKQFSDFIDPNVKRELQNLGVEFNKFGNQGEQAVKNIRNISQRFQNELKDLRSEIQKSANEFSKLNPKNDLGKNKINEAAQAAANLASKNKELEATVKGADTSIKFIEGSLKSMGQELKQLNDVYNRNVTATNKSSQENKELAQRIVQTKTRMRELRRETSVLNRSLTSSEGSYNSLVEQNRRLNDQLRKLPVNFVRTDKSAQQLVKTIRRNTDTLKNYDQALGRNFRNVGNYRSALSALPGPLGNIASQTQSVTQSLQGLNIGAIGAVAAIAALTAGIGKSFSVNRQLSDSFADVRKTTGLTAEGVRELSDDLQRIDTRTSLQGLLQLAEIGGRLGIAQKDILSFTKATDIAAVALGDDFNGGIQDVADSLGKLTGLFEETRDLEIEESFARTGSAINELGANTRGTSENISDFALRIGALPESLRPSQQDALALGAAFEEVGLNAEQSARGFGIFLRTAAKDIGPFARQIGITQEAAEELLNTSPVEFAKQFAASLRGLNATQTAKVLGDLRLNADGVNKVLGALSTQTERLTDIQEISNDAFEKGTSLLDEFNIKNETLQGSTEKLGNAFDNLFDNSRLEDFFKTAIDGLTDLLRFLDDPNINLLEIIGTALSPVSAELLKAEQAGREFARQQEESANKTRVNAAAIKVLNDETGKYLEQLEFEDSTLKDSTFLKEVLAEVDRLRKERLEELNEVQEDNVKITVEENARNEEKIKILKDLERQLTKVKDEATKLNEIESIGGFDILQDPRLGISVIQDGLFDESEKQLKESLDNQIDLLEDFRERRNKIKEQEIEDDLRRKERREQVEQELFDFGVGLLQLGADALVASSERELESLEVQKNQELQIAGNNERAKAEINERFARREDQIRKRQARTEILTQIPINAVQALASPPAPNFLAAGLATAFGFAQLALLPGFFKGVEDLPQDTLAWTGEKGAELVKDGKTGKYSLTPDKATLTYLTKGSTVVPHEQTKQILSQQYQNEGVRLDRSLVKEAMNNVYNVNIENERLISSNQKIVKGIKEVSNNLKDQPRLTTSVINGQHVITEVKKGQKKIYLSNKYRG